MRYSTSLTQRESSCPYFVGSCLGARFETAEYGWPCASPFKGSLISNKKGMNSEVRREGDRTEPDNTSGQIWFPLPVPWKGTNLLLLISAEKQAFIVSHVITDHTYYYKDCQDQIKSATVVQCLKESLEYSFTGDKISSVSIGTLPNLGLACKLVYRSSPLLLQAVKRNKPCLLLICCSLLLLCSINISIDYNCSFAQLWLTRM